MGSRLAPRQQAGAMGTPPHFLIVISKRFRSVKARPLPPAISNRKSLARASGSGAMRHRFTGGPPIWSTRSDERSVGKEVSVRVDLGGSVHIKKNKIATNNKIN